MTDESREKTPVALGEAYISGALTALEDGPRTKLFYELLAEIAEAAGLRAYLPQSAPRTWTRVRSTRSTALT